MTSLENNGQDMDLTELEVMEPKMMIHDELKVIYINEALEEALNDENSNEKKKYDAEKAGTSGLCDETSQTAGNH